jgi:uncharacterized caspase-like protein
MPLWLGNGAYTRFPRLKCAPNDADVVAESLEKIGFHTKKLINADLSNIRTEIEEFSANMNSSDTFVLYYAGHGFSFDRWDYLPELDSETSGPVLLTTSSVSVATLLDEMSRLKSGTNILILDTHFPPMDRAKPR